ncbi:hypothetical protein NL676_008940 [Syzygium grande]|nr:hypothetical protein NL676_008940 [Syzygium grande]
MGIKTARTAAGWPQKSGAHYNQRPTAPSSRKVCSYWLEGRCNRNPCRFLHDASLPRNVYHRAAKQSSYVPEDCHGKGPESSPVNSASSTSGERGDSPKDKNPHMLGEKVCHYWMSGNCVKGNTCPFLHSWYHGVDFAMLAKLDGHKKGVSGIALPSGSTKLYSGSKDGTARIWDCHTGKCDQVINLGGEVGCFTCEGPWVFVGMPNAIKAWNIQNGASYDISGPVGQVHAMEVAKNMLFAGAQEVVRPILFGWLRSIDRTIRVWDLHTLECVQELVGHTDVVMSLLCWDEYLISCSLDRTVKVWGVATEEGSLEVAYTHHEDHGILALSGLMDACGKRSFSVHAMTTLFACHELPSFTERGKIYSRREVRTLQTAPGGLFFTGDAAGMLTVWKWLDSPKSQKEQLPHSMESC